jgi:hypothetical protein
MAADYHAQEMVKVGPEIGLICERWFFMSQTRHSAHQTIAK